MSIEHVGRDETRDRILGVALQLMADHGFAATTTREISDRLGLTKAALYYHFRTKDDLLAAIVAPAMEDLRVLVQRTASRSGRGARRRVVEDYVDLVAAHVDLIQVLSDDPSVRYTDALRAVFPLYERLVQLLAGADQPDTAQRARARAALGAVHAALLRARPEDDRGVVRATALAAGCAALGLRPRRDRT